MPAVLLTANTNHLIFSCPPLNPTPACTQTGKLRGGPADVGVGGEVESSDTNPAMDPSEQSKVADREGSGTNEAQTQFKTSDSGKPWQHSPIT